MKKIGFSDLSAAPKGGVVALGFFDGVHTAHRELFKMAKSEAELRKVPFGIFTFTSESKIKEEAKRLYTTEERLEIIKELGADFAIVADFSEICSLSAVEFVEKVLIEGLDAAVAVAGYNFRFGKDAQGTSTVLAKSLSKHGRYAIIVEKIEFEGEEISSSAIRNLIERGKIEEANLLLGMPYSFFGKVIHGNSKGKKLGFPTVNTETEKNKITPKTGVYRSLALVRGVLYNAITNIGRCPTLGEREIHLETHILDFSGELYGEKIKIFLLGYLREEKRFANEKELIMQINVDKNTAIKENGEEKWQELGLK